MLSLQQTEQIVDKFSNMFWDGWDVIIVNPKIDGYSKISGIFHDGKWGVKKVVEPNSQGLYEIPKRYLNVKRAA